jgi:beta-aspartyl-peptidase (threonine type)
MIAAPTNRAVVTRRLLRSSITGPWSREARGVIVIASANGQTGLSAAWAVLRTGGTALDAVEAGVRPVEDDPADTTVGYGGWPNLAGEVELDASIMDGATRRAGAVAGLRRTRRAVSVARQVMEQLPHVLLVGDGADRFAAEAGFGPDDLLTDAAEAKWRSVTAPLDGVPTREAVRIATDPERVAGTVNFIALDGRGGLASAVSTSGWAWKHPGRAGDSPVIGAGNYADARYGAACCTGYGELAVRTSTARTIVAGMEHGLSPDDACAAALADLWGLADVPASMLVMSVIALSADGRAAAASTVAGRTYVVQDGDEGGREVPRAVVRG